MEKLTIYFSKPYINNGIWQAGTTTSLVTGDYYKYKVVVDLPSDIVDITELEGVVEDTPLN